MDIEVERPNPHCVAYLRADASLWGMTREHDLDEPVRLSKDVPVRLRLAVGGKKFFSWVVDHTIPFVSERASTATHLFVRLYFKDGSFRDVDLTGNVPGLNHGETANVRILIG